MSNKIIFLFHGMGIHTKETMKEDFLDPIEEYAKYYGVKLKKKWQEDFYLVEYDSYFNKILDDWRNDVQRLRGMLPMIPYPKSFSEDFTVLETIDEKLTPENRGFFITHFGDVILYKFLRDVRSWIVTSKGIEIVKEVDKLLKKYDNKRSKIEIHFVGHSLGTSIAVDILNFFYKRASDDDDVDPYYPYLDSLFMFANVSHLIRGNPLKPKVSPIYKTNAKPNLGTNLYLNFRHKFDYFTADFENISFRFQPFWENNYQDSYLDKNLETLTLPVLFGKDVNEFGDRKDELKGEIKEKFKDLKSIGHFHSFKHYISNPDAFFYFVEILKLSDTSNLSVLKDKSFEKYRKISVNVSDIDGLKDLLKELVISESKKFLDIF